MHIPEFAMKKITIITAYLTLGFLVSAHGLTGTYSGGSGTSVDPAQIGSVSDLLELAATEDDYGEHFILTSDLNLSGQSFNSAVIAKDTDSDPGFLGAPFTGNLDGNGHTISNLTIDASGTATNDYLGLFGYVSGGTVSSLTLAGISITTGSEAMYIGGLCGSNDGELSGCSVSGAITTGTDSEITGGLCGHNLNQITTCQSSCSLVLGDSDFNSAGGLCGQNEGLIISSKASGIVSGNGISTVGGLCGLNDGGTITNCAASGSVTGGTAASTIGGLAGSNAGTLTGSRASGAVTAHDSIGGLCGDNSGQVEQCYATGGITMDGDQGYGAGGLIGENSGFVDECYSIGALTLPPMPWEPGGLIGADDGGSVSNSFWNTETSGLTNSAGGTGLTTTQMQTQSIFTAAGWDFSNVWKMDGFPVHLSAAPAPVELVSIEVGGPISVEEETTGQYSCLALYTDGSSSDVTQTADWFVSPTNYASISTNGLLTALNVTTDRTVNVQAVYTDPDGSYTNTLEIIITPTTGPYSGGAGTIEDPYLIADKADLLELRETTSDYDKNFALIANIDLAGEVFTNAVIAPSAQNLNFSGTSFSGTFDGQGYVISNLTIDVTAQTVNDFLGLFGKTQRPKQSGEGESSEPTHQTMLSNMTVNNCSITSGNGSRYSGGLVGLNEANLINCYITGTLTGGDNSKQ